MNESPVIFVGRDFILNEVLDEISQQLRDLGCEVIRGWGAEPPAHTEYAETEYAELFGRSDVILISTRTKCPRALLDSAPHLRGVVFPTIGTESIDLADARELGLVVAHGVVPENFLGMAESTVMLAAALMLDLPGKQRITERNLPRPQPLAMKSHLVRGKTIGFVGFGRIAQAAAERLAGWEVRLLTYDPHIPDEALPDTVERVDLDTLLAQSDVVSIHVALTPETRHMIGARELARMKQGAYLINTARAGAVDEQALIDALKQDQLGGAALDVFAQEPLPADSPLRELDNVILTSHMVGHSREMNEAFIPAAVENVKRILQGKDPLYIRNPDVLSEWHSRIDRLATK